MSANTNAGSCFTTDDSSTTNANSYSTTDDSSTISDPTNSKTTSCLLQGSFVFPSVVTTAMGSVMGWVAS